MSLRYLLGIISVMLNCILLPLGNLFWKKSTLNGYNISVFFSSNFLIGCVFFVTGTILWLYALSIFPFSKIYPFMSFSFVTSAFLGVVLLGERFSITNFFGIVLLIVALFFIIHR